MTLTTFPLMLGASALALLPLAATASTTNEPPGLTGPHLDLSIGYDRVESQHRFEDVPRTQDGLTIRGAIGYDLRVAPRLLIGLEAGVGTTTGSTATKILNRDRLTLSLGRDIDLLARIGYQLGSRTLVYAKMGVANSRLKTRYDAALVNGREVVSRHYDRNALRLGAGIEHGVGRGFSAKAEYRYSRFDMDHGYYRDPERQQFLIGLVYRPRSGN